VDRRNAVFDASFWINAHHAKVLAYLPDYFHLIVPTTVVEEIEYSPPDVNQRTPAGEEAITRLAESGIARHLKRAGMTALSVLARQRRERHDDSAI
jgi:hypothetical protein